MVIAEIAEFASSIKSIFRYPTLIRRTWLVGHLREGVPSLAKPCCLISRQQMGWVLLSIGLFGLDALIN